MTKRYLDVTQEAGAELFSRNISGEVLMLNLLRFRDVADYSEFPELAPMSRYPGAMPIENTWYTPHPVCLKAVAA